ncbi:MAG: undecaprenyl-phosphate galactose phosphotransferase WbaP [Desulfatitalea sp.]|nr:undecaprenyl-phosphate galactose phosphotransferase WbaP [Desulfatitalea sp.]
MSKAFFLPYLKYFFVLGDISSFIIAMAAAGVILFYGYSLSMFHQNLDTFFLLSGFILFFSIFRFWQLGHYVRRKPFWDDVRDAVHVTGLICLIIEVVLIVTHTPFPLLQFNLTWVLALVFIPLMRVGWKTLFVRLKLWQIPTVVLGCGKNAIEATLAMVSEPLMGLDVFVFLSINRESIPKSGFVRVAGRQIPVLPLGNQPVKVLEDLGRPHVVVALESGGVDAFRRLLDTLNRYAERMYIVPSMRGIPLMGLDANYFFKHEVLLLGIRNNLARPLSKTIKRIFDVVCAVILLIVSAPLFVFLIWKIRKDGQGAFYSHSRVGRDGRQFRCYKFRTMVADADQVLQELLNSDPDKQDEWDRHFKLKDDPRVTPVGRFLRRSSLDELPQLWNVLKGDMSLVGPRPIVKEEMNRYKDSVYYYLNVRPGMTGVWQVSGRNDMDYDTRVHLDAWYAKNWSIFYDLTVLLKTLGVVLKKSGAY